MDMQKFLALRKRRRECNNGIRYLNEYFKGLDIAQEIIEHIRGNPLITFEIDVSINSENKININTNVIDKTEWSYTEVGNRKVGDANFINALPKQLVHIGNELLNHVRSIDNEGKLVQNKQFDRFVNYHILNGRIFRKDAWNFVAFGPQRDSIKVSLIRGDYSFLSGITLINDDRYPYFKIDNSVQLQSAKDAIELSYFYLMGWAE